jgi:catechol 2,3-dioxygenase-like lactoylglutathione lyase family enzyme
MGRGLGDYEASRAYGPANTVSAQGLAMLMSAVVTGRLCGDAELNAWMISLLKGQEFADLARDLPADAHWGSKSGWVDHIRHDVAFFGDPGPAVLVVAVCTSGFEDDPGQELVAGRGEGAIMTYPVLMHVAVDARKPRALAEFYRELLGLHYRTGEEPPPPGEPDDADWLVLLDDDESRVLAIQLKRDLRPSTWPSEEVPMQMHLDFSLESIEELEHQRLRAEGLGARLLYDRSADAEEPLYVLADPEGHPFCLLVG